MMLGMSKDPNVTIPDLREAVLREDLDLYVNDPDSKFPTSEREALRAVTVRDVIEEKEDGAFDAFMLRIPICSRSSLTDA
jgi:hypothetical protein